MKHKGLHHPEYHLTSQKFRINSIKDPKLDLQQACLLKYFPKYYNRFETKIIQEKSRRLVSKLSQTKIMKHCVCSEFGESSKSFKFARRFEEKIFMNKRKSVKSLPSIPSETKDGKCKISTFFPRITSLDFTKLPQFQLTREEMSSIDPNIPQLRIFKHHGHFWKAFRCLKHLGLSTKNPSYSLLLKKINSSPILLASLETLKFNIDEAREIDMRSVFKEISEYKNLLKRLTHLNLDALKDIQYYYDKEIGPIIDECPRLTSLSLPWKASFFCEEEIQVLDRLRILSIVLHNELKTFFDDFSISPETLVLKFPEQWQGDSWDQLFDNELEKDNNVFEICKEKLQNLRNLEIDLPIIRKSNESLEKFVLPLFRVLPSLKTFKCNPKLAEDNDAEEDYEPGKPFPHDILDFSLFLDCIESKKELDTFEINYQEEEYPLKGPHSTIKFSPQRRYELSGNLERVSLCFRFFQDFDFQSFFEIFLANNGGIKYLKLSMIYFDCPDALNGFLRLVDERIADSKSLKLDLEVTLYVDNLDKIFCCFKKPIVLSNNVAVMLNMIFKPPAAGAPTLKMTDEIKDDFGRIFGNFHYNLIEFRLFHGSDSFAFRSVIGSRT